MKEGEGEGVGWLPAAALGPACCAVGRRSRPRGGKQRRAEGRKGIDGPFRPETRRGGFALFIIFFFFSFLITLKPFLETIFKNHLELFF